MKRFTQEEECFQVNHHNVCDITSSASSQDKNTFSPDAQKHPGITTVFMRLFHLTFALSFSDI